MPVFSAAAAAGIALAGPAATALAALGYHYRERERDPSRGLVSDNALADKGTAARTRTQTVTQARPVDLGRDGRRLRDLDQMVAGDNRRVTDFPPTSTQAILNRQQINSSESGGPVDTNLRQMLTPGVRSVFKPTRDMTSNIPEDKHNVGPRSARADNTHWLAQRDMLPHSERNEPQNVYQPKD
ncbi:hypothetical protein IWQ62_002757 [Dispira parvispora]|uniref:Uncharacterized protein n=1 Tax=Dispira parvispora TaxID=1520584 RepID=A0A9W8AW36_9FUNG|nr:hypothetical protein IWQ62_002757 [Dispira parvispora]